MCHGGWRDQTRCITFYKQGRALRKVGSRADVYVEYVRATSRSPRCLPTSVSWRRASSLSSCHLKTSHGDKTFHISKKSHVVFRVTTPSAIPKHAPCTRIKTNQFKKQQHKRLANNLRLSIWRNASDKKRKLKRKNRKRKYRNEKKQ